MAEEKFKLPGSSYEELTKIIKSYNHFSGPASLEDVSKLIGIDKTIISRNAGFLMEMCILEPGQKKAMTVSVKQLAQALEHEMPDEIVKSWRALVNENDFSMKLVTAIKIRNGMDEGTLQSHIAYSAGQPKKSQVMTGAKTLIDILRASELIKANDGKYIVPKNDDFYDASTNSQNYHPNRNLKESTESHTESYGANVVPVATIVPNGFSTEVKININVTIDCKVSELDQLGDKIRGILAKVSTVDLHSEDQSNE